MTTDILFIIPPFTQLNCAYPSTAFLNGFLKKNGIISHQYDLAIDTINSLLSANGLKLIFKQIADEVDQNDAQIQQMLALKDQYIHLIEPVKAFLQGVDNSLATGFAGNQLPQGKRFEQLRQSSVLFGDACIYDKAKYKATLFIEDIGDLISKYIDTNFGFSRYAEHLGIKAHDFDLIVQAVNKESIVTEFMYENLHCCIERYNPLVIGISIPFHGNLIAALKSAKYIKQHFPQIKVVLGGGYVNTELRQLHEPRLFEWVDYVTLDDGEMPLLQLIDFIKGKHGTDQLLRTFYCQNQVVSYANNGDLKDTPHLNIGPPDYTGINPQQYFSVLEMVNPMHRLWTDGWWNKLMLAHGCYWHQCSFCDTSLDYIGRYSIANANVIGNWIETIIAQTKKRGFHFVDEAAPPMLLKNLAIELLRRKIKINWWVNIRFDPAFTDDVCQLLAASGCIAVSGGLETASDRLLELMKKGVSIDQVSNVTANFKKAGILVHAYLMYGFPTQTVQETIDSLEVVRQLFENKLVQSAYWHRFALTVHSPVYQQSQRFAIKIIPLDENSFAQNDVDFIEEKPVDHEQFGPGLHKAVFNYMHNQCVDFSCNEWFDFKTPKTTHSTDRIEKVLKNKQPVIPKGNQQILWIGEKFTISQNNKGMRLKILYQGQRSNNIDLEPGQFAWFNWLTESAIPGEKRITYNEIVEKYSELAQMDFDIFSLSKPWKILRQSGLLIL